MRDGLPVIETLFLYAGFVFAGNKTSLATLAKWFPRILVVGVFYCTLYPFREALRAMSPVVSGMQGQPVPVFFTFVTSQMLLVVAAAFVLERYRQTNAWRYLFFAAVAVSLPLVLIPSRTLLLMILMLFTYFFFSGKLRLSVGMAWVVGIGMALFVALFSLGIENTRLGLTSLTDYKTLFFEIFPGTESTDPLTSGASSRLRWWSNIYQQLTASWEKLVFGLGYGIPLTDLGLRGGVVIYAPHNTLVSVVARGGLVAGFVFVWLQGIIVYRAWTTVRWLRDERKDSSLAVALLFVIFTVLIISIGEAPFVFPYNVVPYYFSAGVLLRMYYKAKADESPQRDVAQTSTIYSTSQSVGVWPVGFHA